MSTSPRQRRARVPAATLASVLLATLTTAALALVSSGCTTSAFCFTDCGDTTSTSTGTSSATGPGSGGSGAGGDDCFPSCGGNGPGTGGSCVVSNNGVEKCDTLDNDCDGKVDNSPDIDLGSPKSCGVCENNCYAQLDNCDPSTISCTASAKPGIDAGACVCGKCAIDYYDLDDDGKCEYYCVESAVDESICNNKDDDCDGEKDENVDLCTSTTDCGKCGGNCTAPHGTATCATTGVPPDCDPSNTQCKIAACTCVVGDCWWDLDGSYATGCEYPCEETNNGVEKCGDGLDNDCDGKIDAADDDVSMDPAIGVPCFGDPDGECSLPAHAGVTICQGSTVVCGGNDVLVENQKLETCDGIDNDCDGDIDDSPTDVGAACGQSNIFPCAFGAKACQGGVLVCVGAVAPGIETCNGQDDDCDGTFDKAGGNPPADSVGPCDIPPAPPLGVTQPCKAGTKTCLGGVVGCVGSTVAATALDGCGDDSNCDGVLDNQPDTQSDVANCGACGNDCNAGGVQATWACVLGVCEFQGCVGGYYDLDGDEQCEYPCVFVQAQETCNGVDDNCNGVKDENVVAPSPAQVCGVSPAATRPECTSQVVVACPNGSWSCSFPADVCPNGNCAGATEVCDNLDNDCDGALNENVPNFNQPCFSDQGLPPPGHGACRTVGTSVCNGPNATMCGAVPGDCALLPGGCTEECDGVDNDCDGLVDEPFSSKGANAANFVKPIATRIAASSWIYTYEASRPSATASAPGTGNGYHCTGASCVGVPSAPAGETLDKTPACSAPGKIPWFNVSPVEVEETCQAMGGAVCSNATWQTACQAEANCSWGYNPNNGTCATPYSGTTFCNLGPSYDFNPLGLGGDQDGLLATASPLLGNCWADWSGLQSNTAATEKLYDITGNLREITKEGTTYRMMGGAFSSQTSAGAACTFTFYTAPKDFKFYDTGFRCCFTADPTL